MATPSPASPSSTTRPYNALLLTTFAILSVAGLWFMRVSLVLYDAPKDFLAITEAGVHPNGTPIRKQYTGLQHVDKGLSVLVTAFLAGPAGWNETFYWQQFHFLHQITGLIAIMNIEACGAIVLPIWMLLFHRLACQNTYFASGRALPQSYARAILPGTLLFYLVPTTALFLPGQSMHVLQASLACWQFAPLLANLPLWLVALPWPPSSSSSKPADTDDTPHLKATYNTVFLVSTLSHWTTIYKVAASESPHVSLARVFLPHTEHWLASVDEGLLWVFQCDWLIIAACYVLAALTAVYDVQRLLPDLDTDPAGDKMFKGVYVVVALTVLGGPGAALAMIWSWREDKMAIMEERAGNMEVKKGI
ncbi:hypothetical protein ACEQ8H_000377 [Pleosporales sp. CAS-2024a]